MPRPVRLPGRRTPGSKDRPSPPGGSTVAFEELLTLLRSEFSRLQLNANYLALENSRLRMGFGQTSGTFSEDGLMSYKSVPSITARHDTTTSSKWRALVEGDNTEFTPGDEEAPTPTEAQSITLTLPDSAVQPDEREEKGLLFIEDMSEEEEVASIRSEDRRLDVCTTKLREFLELSATRQTVSIDRIEDYLKRIGRPTDALMEALPFVFDMLVQRERRGNIATVSTGEKGDPKSMFANTAMQTSNSLGKVLEDMPNPAKAKRSLSNIKGVGVRLQTLAELLLADDVREFLGPCSDDTLELVRLLRMCTFHQDTLGILPSLRAVNDLEQECKAVALESRLDIVMNLVIAANAICVGVFASTESPTGWGGAELSNLVFTLIFLCEAVFKVRRHGFKRYFFGPDWAWNVFDVSIVALGISDFFMTLALVASGSFNTSSLMVLKLLRLGRLLRVLRMSVFRELKLMINGILGLFKTLSCAMIILLVSVYLIGTVMVQFLAGRDNQSIVSGQDRLFSTVPKSMFTVFRCLNLGDCAAADGTPIALHLSEEIGWPFTIVHSILCVIMHYGLGSLMTALVVETTLNEAKKAEFRATLKDSHKKQVSWSLHRLEQIFEEAQRKDKANTSIHLPDNLPSMLFIGKKTFDTVVHLEEVQRIFDLLDIDAADRVDLFDALDSDGNGYIEIDEVVTGLLSMAGKARRADVVATRLKIDALVKRFATTHAELLESHGHILERIDSLSACEAGMIRRGSRTNSPCRTPVPSPTHLPVVAATSSQGQRPPELPPHPQPLPEQPTVGLRDMAGQD